MLTRKWIIKKDYPFISNWCKQRDWDSSIPKEILPAVGVIVIDQDPICAAGLFVDKTSNFVLCGEYFLIQKQVKQDFLKL